MTPGVLLVIEGGRTPLTNTSLVVADLDSPPSQLSFTLLTKPSRGDLVKKESAIQPMEEGQFLENDDKFTYQDMLNKLIIYRHDDGENTNDSIILQLSDGTFTSKEITLPIAIGLADDETPRGSVNTGLMVDPGECLFV